MKFFFRAYFLSGLLLLLGMVAVLWDAGKTGGYGLFLFLLPALFFHQSWLVRHCLRLERRFSRRERHIRSWLASQRRTEERLLEEDRPLLLTGPSGRIRRASAAAVRLIGLDPSGGFISGFSGAVPGRQGGVFTTHAHPHGKTLLYWIPLVTEGRKWQLGLDITPYMEREERLMAEAETFRRLAEQKSDGVMVAGRRIQDLSAMATLGRMTAGISHDFNNILSAILGSAQMAEMVPDAGRRKHHIGTILSAGYRARDLIQQILHFSRPEPVVRRAFSLKPLIGESLRLIRASLPAHIVLRCRNEAGDACLHGDPTRIYQLLINLMTNACHAMEDNGGILSLDIRKEGSGSRMQEACLRITVRDTGHGIPEQIRQRIFEPFFTTRPRGEGSGMGLALVRDVVEEHGGRISVDSRPGAGAVFQIDLPLAAEAGEAPAPDSARPFRGRGMLLLVEDDAELLSLFREMAVSLGYGVEAFREAGEAWKWMQHHAQVPDLALVDYAMPEMNGLALTRRLRTLRPDLPLVMMTGCPHWVGERASVEGLLEKPFSLQDFSRVLAQAAGDGQVLENVAPPDAGDGPSFFLETA